MARPDRIARRARATQRPPRRELSSVPYLPGLDGMRALAVVAVMVYHANDSWLPGGFIGVEVFFVISGYLITLLLIGEHERSGRISLGQFYLRRARRLLPALFTMLTLIIVYAALVKRDELGRMRGDVLAGLGYVSNWYQIWVGQGYTAAGEFAPLRHLWSLAVEEQFYLVWPLLMIGLIRVGGRRLPSFSRWLLLAAVVITVAVGLLFYSGSQGTPAATPGAYWHVGERSFAKTDTLYLSTITRSTGLLVGAALAMLWRPLAVMRSPLRRKGWALDGLAVIGLGSLAVLAWRLHVVNEESADPFLFRGGLLAVDLAAMLMIAAVTHRGAWSGALLGNRILLWVGTRSYGMYLYHWPIYQIIRKAAGNPLDIRQFAVAMMATAAITELSYRFVEMPIRRRQIAVWIGRLRVRAGPIGRRAVGFGTASSVALLAFAGASMATAKLEPTDVDLSLQQGEGAVTDLSATIGVPVDPDPPRPPGAAAGVETTEPATTEPATTEPATTELATTEPATTELATTEPATTEPATTEVATTEVATTERETTEAATSDPATTEPATTATDTTDPVTVNTWTPVTAPPTTTGPTSTNTSSTTTVAATAPPTSPSTTVAPTSVPRTTVAPTTVPPTTSTLLPTTTSTTTTTIAPTTTTGPPVVIAIGDSVMLGAAENLQERGVIVDASVSRQMIDYVPVVQQLAAEGRLGDVVVVHLGTNGSFSEATMTAFFGALRDVPKVVVLTIHAPRGWVAHNNALIFSLPDRYSNIDLIDWNAAVGGCPGDCLYDDGIHLPPAGRRYYAQLIFDHAGI